MDQLQFKATDWSNDKSTASYCFTWREKEKCDFTFHTGFKRQAESCRVSAGVTDKADVSKAVRRLKRCRKCAATVATQQTA